MNLIERAAMAAWRLRESRALLRPTLLVEALAQVEPEHQIELASRIIYELGLQHDRVLASHPERDFFVKEAEMAVGVYEITEYGN